MYLEDANTGDIICKPFLDVSGDLNNKSTMNTLILIKDGYSRFDYILKIELNDSLYDSDDNAYPLFKNSEYSILNSTNGDIFNTYLVDIYEESSKTIIELYIKISDYIKYFKDLIAGDSLNDYTFIYGSDLEIGYTECQFNYDIIFNDLKSTGFTVKITGDNADDLKHIMVTYRKYGDIEWSHVLSNSNSYTITSLVTKTKYEVKCLVYCNYPYIYSFYSDIYICKTL